MPDPRPCSRSRSRSCCRRVRLGLLGAPGAGRDGGQVVLLLAVLLVVLAAGGLLLGRVSVVATDAARARTAADAAALAGAAGGREAAVELAEANGGVLVGWADEGARIVVAVRVGDVEATAAASSTVACVDARGVVVLC